MGTDQTDLWAAILLAVLTRDSNRGRKYESLEGYGGAVSRQQSTVLLGKEAKWIYFQNTHAKSSRRYGYITTPLRSQALQEPFIMGTGGAQREAQVQLPLFITIKAHHFGRLCIEQMKHLIKYQAKEDLRDKRGALDVLWAHGAVHKISLPLQDLTQPRVRALRFSLSRYNSHHV